MPTLSFASNADIHIKRTFWRQNHIPITSSCELLENLYGTYNHYHSILSRHVIQGLQNPWLKLASNTCGESWKSYYCASAQLQGSSAHCNSTMIVPLMIKSSFYSTQPELEALMLMLNTLTLKIKPSFPWKQFLWTWKFDKNQRKYMTIASDNLECMIQNYTKSCPRKTI